MRYYIASSSEKLLQVFHQSLNSIINEVWYSDSVLMYVTVYIPCDCSFSFHSTQGTRGRPADLPEFVFNIYELQKS